MPIRFFAGLLVLAILAPLHAADPQQILDEALREARAKRATVLVDFHAPWCYSCYYMAKNVLTGPEWDQLRRSTVVLALDADSPEGTHWSEAWKVKAMPTYLVLTENGEELGRILGEQTRAEFYTKIAQFTQRADTHAGLKAKVVDAAPESVAAGREVLRIFHARYEAAAGLDWFFTLPAAARSAVSRDAEAALWVARLELLRSTQDKDTESCLKAGRMVLAGSLGCERPYELSRVLACAESQPLERRQSVLGAETERMTVLLDKRVFVEQGRCADERSAVLAAADLHDALDDKGSRALVLSRAVADVQRRLGDDVKRDRNLADNLRVYLDRAGKTDALDGLFEKLIAAYPEDYVYPYRYGKSLAARGRHKEAMPHYHRAFSKAYGVNRLRVAELWARSYKGIGRPLEGQQIIAQALQANGPFFPEEVAKLKALQAELAAGRKG